MKQPDEVVDKRKDYVFQFLTNGLCCIDFKRKKSILFEGSLTNTIEQNQTLIQKNESRIPEVERSILL